MEYSRLGRAGLKVSRLSLGSWVTFGKQVDAKLAERLMAMAFERGVNFFDNAEVYAGGQAEELMGQALQRLKWPRVKYIISTKFFWGISDGPNERNTLNRKYLLQAMEGSLKRLSLDYVDVVYCHRPDPQTPMEEICWAMHDLVSRGHALYWGTSEWSARELVQAFEICERHHLRKPIVEQPQYNLLVRDRVEREYAPVIEQYGLGLTTWSPLASGILTGKYLNGSLPSGSRLAIESLGWLKEDLLTQEKEKKIKQLVAIAKDLNVECSELAIAWCLKNQSVSSVILGATSERQLESNLKSLELLSRLDGAVMERLNAISTQSL